MGITELQASQNRLEARLVEEIRSTREEVRTLGQGLGVSAEAEAKRVAAFRQAGPQVQRPGVTVTTLSSLLQAVHDSIADVGDALATQRIAAALLDKVCVLAP